MKKILAILLTAVLLISACSISAFALAQDGDVYLIGTAAELVEFKNLVNADISKAYNAKLTADIDMSSVTDWTPIGGVSTDPSKNDGYIGIFDGNGKTIKNLNVTVTAGDTDVVTALLFTVLSNGGGVNAEAKNFTLKDSSLTIVSSTADVNVYAGVLCNNVNRAKAIGVTFENVDLKVTGKIAGGAIGLVSQNATWAPNWFENITTDDKCSVETDSLKLFVSGFVARSFNDKFEAKNCVINTSIIAPAANGAVAAYFAIISSAYSFDNCTNNAKVVNKSNAKAPEFSTGECLKGAEAIIATSEILNDKIDKTTATGTGVKDWGESNVANFFDDNLFGTKYAGNFEKDATVTWNTTEAVKMYRYALVTGNDSAGSSGRNALSWTISGSATGADGSWTVLDDVNLSGLGAANDTAYVFAVDAPASYQYYKIVFHSVYSGGFQHDSLIMLGESTYKNFVITPVAIDGTTATVTNPFTQDDRVTAVTADNLFDAYPNTTKMEGWKTAGTSLIINFETAAAAKLGYYSIVTGNDDGRFPARTPTAWKFYGSANGTDYTLLDTRTDYDIKGSNFETLYEINPTTAYKYYRLEITEFRNEHDNPEATEAYLQVGQLFVYEKSCVAHTYGAVVTTSPATCSAPGSGTKTCTVCGHVETVTLTKLPHVDANNDGHCDVCNVETGDISLVVLVLSIIALAGVAVVIKKRRMAA